jgi:hypothetical protein
MTGTFEYVSQLAEGAVSVWFVSWAIRRRYELDIKLDQREQLLRRILIAAAFGLTLLGGPHFAVVRIIAGISGLTFLAWPNLARHAMGLLEQLHLVQGTDRKP